MDPSSITGLVAACASLAKITCTGLQSAYNAQQQYTNIQSNVISLLGKLNSIAFSLSLLEEWSARAETINSRPALLPHLKASISNCELIISAINTKVKQSTDMSVSDKIKLLWSNEVIKTFESDLDSQIQALTLLLQTVQFTNNALQQQKLDEHESQTIFKKASDVASTYEESVYTHVNPESLEFSFDDAVVNSVAYRRAFAQQQRRLVASGSASASRISEETLIAPEKHQENPSRFKFLPFSTISTYLVARGAMQKVTLQGSLPVPLIKAIEGGFPWIVRYFFENGITINDQSSTREALLLICRKARFDPQINELVANQANLESIYKQFICPPYLKDKDHQKDDLSGTILHELAWISNSVSLDMMERLLARDSTRSIDVKATGDLTPLHCAIIGPTNENSTPVEMVKLLLRHKADVNIRPKTPWKPTRSLGNRHPCPDRCTTLQLACVKGTIGIVEYIVSTFGRSVVEDKDDLGHSAIHYAAGIGDTASLKIMQKVSPNLHARSRFEGAAPLHYACSTSYGSDSNVDAIFYLLHALVTSPVTTYGETPLHYAAAEGNHLAASYLLDRGADIEAVSADGLTPLMLAACRGHEFIVRLLAEKGAQIDITTRQTPYTALMLACWFGQLEAVQALINFGADVYAVSDNGFTVLDITKGSIRTGLLTRTLGRMKRIEALLIYDMHVPESHFSDDSNRLDMLDRLSAIQVADPGFNRKFYTIDATEGEVEFWRP